MKGERAMDGRHIFAVVLVTALTPCAAAFARDDAELGKLIDLTGDAADIDAWARRHASDVYPCASTGETPPALVGTIRAGALILSRSRAKAEPSSKIFRTSDDALLGDSAAMGLGTSVGFDITVLTALSEYSELEARYFGIDGWNTSQTASDPGGVRFDGFGALLAGQSERMDYASRLYNVEFNFRPRVAEGIPLIFGVRTVQLHERFEMLRLDPPPESIGVSAHVNNYLWGFQIGAEPYLFGAGGPLTLEGSLKGGIYGNHASQGAFSSVLDTSAEAARNRASFVGEVGLTIDYRFSRFFAARAGYELIWLSGVALAPDQGPSTDLAVPLAAIDASGTAFYQGAAASLEFVF
ncbi:MAG: hypothetical protein ACYC35_28625 [Pirellulales bacterium]